MPDWSKSMTQSFEYYTVDPNTWKDIKKLNNVLSSTISRDISADTLGSATFEVTDTLGECYIRVYLVTIQNGITEKFPLGTYIVQTPSSNFNGKYRKVSMDAYTPLLELKENPPPLGYSLLEGTNILGSAYSIMREHMRGPVVKTESNDKLNFDFVSNTEDTWLTFTKDLISNAKYVLDMDEMGRTLFAPKQDTASLQPVATFTDDNSSILYSDVSMEHDLYGIPNVIEVVYSKGRDIYFAKAVNDDHNSPLSIQNRGREILHRVIDPELGGEPTQMQVTEYANQLLRDLSSVEYTVSYTHAYCPVRIGDCVRLNYNRAGLRNVKARVISQSIKCVPGCPVSEKAVFTNKLWG